MSLRTRALSRKVALRALIQIKAVAPPFFFALNLPP
jgi:hypothetical protein